MVHGICSLSRSRGLLAGAAIHYECSRTSPSVRVQYNQLLKLAGITDCRIVLALTVVHLGAALSTLSENCRCCKFSTPLCSASFGIWYQIMRQGFFPPVGWLCVITVR